MDWKPTESSVIWEFHFEEHLISKGDRWTLKWKSNPVPTILTEEMKATPRSVLPTPTPPPWKPPTKRSLEVDQMDTFLSKDIINNFSEINESHAPAGFSFNKTNDHIVFYNLSYIDGFPVILKSVKIDRNLHVQLQYNGHPVTLPAWFTVGRNATLTRFSQLNEFPNSIRIVAESSES